MSHLIDETTGNPAVFVTGKPPWHQLGTVVEEAPSSEDAIKLAGLDWEVEQRSIHFDPNPDEEIGVIDMRHIPGYLVNYRTDTEAPLGVVSNRYKPIQNREAFSFLDDLMQDGEVKYESAGSVKGGRLVWMLARLPEEYRIGGMDDVRPYVMFTTAHDGMGSTVCCPTVVRVVCWNTIKMAVAAAMEQKQALSIRHTGNVEKKLEDARQAIQLTRQMFIEFTELGELLFDRAVNQDDTTEYVERIFPSPEEGSTPTRTINTRKAVIDSFIRDPRQENSRGTAWGLLNAATQFIDHDRPARGQTLRAKAQSRFNSSLFGEGVTRKREMVGVAKEMFVN